MIVNLETVIYDICPICGSGAGVEILLSSGGSYVYCEKCDIAYLKKSPKSIEYTGRHRIIQDKINWDFSAIKRDRYYYPLIKKIRKYLRTGTEEKDINILDIGCGNGAFLDSVKKLTKWSCTGLEPAEDTYKFCTEKLKLNVIKDTLKHDMFSYNSFDIVTMWQVFEHIKNPHYILKEIFKILKHGGIVALSTPNIAGLSRFICGQMWKGFDPDVHYLLYSKSSLRNIFVSNGFVPVDIRSLDFWPDTFTCIKKRLKIKNRKIKGDGSFNLQVKKDRLILKYRQIFAVRDILNTFISAAGIGDDLYAFFIKPF